jgi:hypothetical protein
VHPPSAGCGSRREMKSREAPDNWDTGAVDE